MVEVIGFVLAGLIGISLGMIGGGGSILTVPVLVYLLGISPIMATAYSLFIVGLSSLVGSFRYAVKGLIDYKTALIFGISSIVSVYVTRHYLLPTIPNLMLDWKGFVLDKSTFMMLVFASLMLLAAYKMIKNQNLIINEASDQQSSRAITVKLLFQGLIIGVFTGLVGAGGGFLIIPALVMLVRLKMKVAVGTSLFIITINSFIGFIGDLGHYDYDWRFLFTFSTIAIVGIFVGGALSNKINGAKLKSIFGWFVLLMGIGILIKELFF